MNHHQRLTVNQNPAVGTHFFTPPQQLFRETNAGGRWATGAGQDTANATAFHMKCHEDGTVDMIRLEAQGDGWQDLGGSGAPDATVRRY